MSVLHLSWTDYVSRVKAAVEDDREAMSKRMKIVETMRRLFSKGVPFCAFTSDEQEMVAGISKFQGVDYGWFSPMTKAGPLVVERAEQMSEALEAIPQRGLVTRQMFSKYVEQFEATFKSNVGMSSYTRPLAMKRPDVFVCISMLNEKALCADFGLKPSDFSKKSGLNSYWESVILPIQNSAWWKSLMPDAEPDRTLWEWRVAFLDRLYRGR
jgi:hypothetical protein